MNDSELGGVVRALRHRRRWRQVDLARAAGVSQTVVSDVERGRVWSMRVETIRRLVTALDIRLSWDAGYRGAELERLRDADHARVGERVANRLAAYGWLFAAEVTFNVYGDRGRIDLLAFHPSTRTLLVIEVKTVIADIQSVLGSLDQKRRVASGVARSRGWRPSVIVPMLAVLDGTTNRRRIALHQRLFGGLTLRGRSALAFLRRPTRAERSPEGILLFVKLPPMRGGTGRRAGRQRMRLPAGRLSTNRASGSAYHDPDRA
jgi:transcriptional regulator with XRE-family HTH domain